MRSFAATLAFLALSLPAFAGPPAKASAKPAAAEPVAPDSAAKAVGEIPALPKAASKDLDCSAGEKMQQRLEQRLQADMATLTAPGASTVTPQSLSAEQATALQSLNDNEFYACIQDLQMRPAELWLSPFKERLYARLEEVDAAKTKSDEAYCTAHPQGEGCASDPGSIKRFNAQAADAGTQFLREAQPTYAGYLKEIGDCVARREKVIATARTAGIGGAMESMLTSATQMNWGLAVTAAGAHASLCESARNAARKYLESP
jgi:hypothetical protein